MSDSVLSRMALGCVPLWGRQRDIAGLLLQVRSVDGRAVDGAHLHAVLADAWVQRAPRMLLQFDHADTLAGWLSAVAPGAAQSGGDLPVAIVPDAWLGATSAVRAAVQRALQAGQTLVWRGPLAALRDRAPAWADMPALVQPDVPQTLLLLAHAQRLATPGAAARPAGGVRPPSLSGLLCEGLASTRLAAHALDDAGAAGIAGWPVEDAAHHTPTPGAPSRRVILSLLEDIERDLSLELLEQRMSRDALLAWRFLRLANSAGLGLPGDVGSIRHALMMVGVSPLRQWLSEQLVRASADTNLRPLQDMSVLAAQLMQAMVHAGSEQELLRELYLCGLFSELDLLAGEPLSALLQHVPLSGRVREALLWQGGAYGQYLGIVRAQLGRDTTPVARTCEAAGISLDEANRTLLRILGRWRPEQRLPLYAPAALAAS